jgi:hypothetical protein
VISALEDGIAKKLTSMDRVVFFFAGHGFTARYSNEDWGYIIPYDGSADQRSTFIAMEELQAQSLKMGIARHQLFIMDACYSGLLISTRSGSVDPSVPGYIQELQNRKARQILTAGGKGQQVLDGGPNGNSFFTAYFLEALRDGKADFNGDGFITFSELFSYLQPKATNVYQTPASGVWPGHEGGEFVFVSTRKNPGVSQLVSAESQKRGIPNDQVVVSIYPSQKMRMMKDPIIEEVRDALKEAGYRLGPDHETVRLPGGTISGGGPGFGPGPGPEILYTAPEYEHHAKAVETLLGVLLKKDKIPIRFADPDRAVWWWKEYLRQSGLSIKVRLGND